MKNQVQKILISTLILVFLTTLAAVPQQAVQAEGSIILPVIGIAYTETFDSLASAGTSSIVPLGWSFLESGGSANTAYTANDGSSNTGDTYSYGALSATERAFGILRSTTLQPLLGASFTNNTGVIINELVISYTGEQWRTGTTGRTDRLDFQFSLDATSLTSGTWMDVDELDFTSPYVGSAGARDGNAPEFRTTLNHTILGLEILPGASFWIRWQDFDAAGPDDGLSIDNFSLTPAPDSAPKVASTIPASNAVAVPMDADITITFNEPVQVTGTWFTIVCKNSEAHTAAVSGGPQTYVLDPDVDFRNYETCVVTVLAAQVNDLDPYDPPDLMAANYAWTFSTADPAPSVTGTTPADGATNVAMTANLSISFDEPVDVFEPWFNITCSSSGVHTGVTGGGPTSFSILVDPDFVPAEQCTVTLFADKVQDRDSVDPEDYMLEDYTWSFFTTFCSLPSTPIHQIQGSGDASTMEEEEVTIEGVVTADLQLSTQLRGIFVQTIPGLEDLDEATSEGVFVYTGSNYLEVTSGKYVRLTGVVDEYTSTSYGQMVQMTEISPVSELIICPMSKPMPAATEIDLPDVADDGFVLEQFEGMRVTFPETLTVQQNYFQGRFGQLTLGAGGRIAQMNNLTLGGGSLYDYTRMIILDDGSHTQNPDTIPFYPTYGSRRAGDTTTGLVGVLDQGRINSSTTTSAMVFPNVYYRLHPTTAPVFVPLNPRPALVPDAGGRLKVVGANVLNYFTTIDCGAPDEDCIYDPTSLYDSANRPRGADSAVELTRQQDKLIASLVQQNADVYALTEIESWDGAGAPEALVSALNAYLSLQGSPNVYAAVADPALGYFQAADGGDYIQVALIYKTNTVKPVGESLSTDDTIFSRSPFAQEFEELATGEQFVVVANHFKSKGSCPLDGSLNDDQDDGQGCWNLLRVEQAEALLTFIEDTLIPLDEDVLVIGDLNAYGAEDPIATLTTAGLVDQIAALLPEADRYTYVFDGAAGYLDHALTTAALGAQLAGVKIWHINADEPSVIDYNTEYKDPLPSPSSPDLYHPDPYRSSDHDTVIVGVELANSANDAPTLVNPIADQSVRAEQLYTFTLPADTFTDLDLVFGDVLTITVTLEDGSPLPDWLTFDALTGTLSGTPAEENTGDILAIKVTASDIALETAFDVFNLEVLPPMRFFYLPVVMK